MEKLDFIFLIISCEKYREKAEKQKLTWIPKLPSFLLTSWYHVIGKPDLTQDFLFDDTNRVLTVKAKDDYNSLPQKVIMAYKAVQTRFNFLYIFKTDDDQMVKDTRSFELIRNVLLQKTPHYGGYIIDVKQPHISKYNTIHPELPDNLQILPTKYCNGRFYFLSKEAVAYLVDRLVLFNNEYLEDYAIGFHLKKSLKEKMLFIDTNKIFKDFICE